jgi:hypothetical protein
MEKPDTEKGSAEAVHPGAAAYYDNTEESFMDRYGDWLYISAMAFSGLGSVIAAMFGLTRARARKAALALVDQLIEVKQIAHTTKELSRLGGLEVQIEELSTKGLRYARDKNFEGWPRYGSPLTKLVGRSAISAMSSKQSHCS